MKPRTKLFVILWSAGMAGVLSFLLVDMSALIASLPVPQGAEVLTVTPALKLLSLLQPTVLLTLAVLGGVALASGVGLSSPAAEAIANGRAFGPALRPQILPGLLGGVAGGMAIILTQLPMKQLVPSEVISKISELAEIIPFPTRLLYGGITEELLIRWGLMTLLVWAACRLFQKGADKPRAASFVVAIVISSVIFALGHLPFAFLLIPNISAALILYIIVANSLFGLIAGFLYWKKGLEAAILAHIFTHVTLQAATSLGAFS